MAGGGVTSVMGNGGECMLLDALIIGGDIDLIDGCYLFGDSPTAFYHGMLIDRRQRFAGEATGLITGRDDDNRFKHRIYSTVTDFARLRG